MNSKTIGIDAYDFPMSIGRAGVYGDKTEERHVL